MKSEVIQPIEGEFGFTKSDRFVNYDEKNGANIMGILCLESTKGNYMDGMLLMRLLSFLIV